MRHRNVLQYANFRYLKLALLIAAGALVAYAYARPPSDGPRLAFGSTWTGYGLGTLGALLVIWLLYFGVRKRSYRSGATVQGWLSAHIYLGIALVAVATLHTGFSFGWNVHTLAYVLMVLVIASGLYGVYAYLTYPEEISRNMGDESLEKIAAELADLDRDATRAALQLPDDVNRAVALAAAGTRLGGGAWQQLAARQRNDPTDRAVRLIEETGKRYKGESANQARELYSILVRKQNLVMRARRDIRIRALLQLWLYVHVPLSIGLVVALTAHILSIFFYY